MQVLHACAPAWNIMEHAEYVLLLVSHWLDLSYYSQVLMTSR